MSKPNLWRTICLVCVFCAVAAIGSPAQTFTTLFSFNGTDGADPEYGPLVQGLDGNFYGTTLAGGTPEGGAYGTIFKITPGGTLTTLHSFDIADGATLWAGLVLATDGNFYGTTSVGGAYGWGTVFKITPTGALTTLYSFCATLTNCADGAGPLVALVQASNGNFYGTTPSGAATGSVGTIFQITPGGEFTTLYTFCAQPGCPDGGAPGGPLIQATDGNLYGVTGGGGAYGWGTVFKINPTTRTLTTLYSFCSQTGCTDGAGSFGPLVQATDGNLYGVAGGGANGVGIVFKITLTGTLTTLHSFDGADGSYPVGGLVQATDGNFYGTTEEGGDSSACSGYGCGTVFEMTPNGTLTTLHIFEGPPDGSFPVATLLQATNGNLYGTTIWGGDGCASSSVGCGTVFSLAVGPAPAVTLSPTSLGFGNQPVTITSAAQSVTLTNSGAAPLSISSITPSGDFAEKDNCPLDPNTLPAGAPCTINVTFTPTATGSRTGAITITDNAANSPQSVPLSGTGTDFSVSASPSTQTIPAGKSTTYTLSVAPISGFTGPVALSCSGAPPLGSCTISPTSVSLNGTITATATVTTTTTGKGKKGTPKGTYTLMLTGTFSTLSHSTHVTLTVK